MVVAIRLPAGDAIAGDAPRGPREVPGPFGAVLLNNLPEPWAPREDVQDFFEPGGRVCIKEFAPLDVLMPGHATTFDALRFGCHPIDPTDVPLLDYRPILGGKTLELDYRIDAEDTPTITGQLSFALPTTLAELLPEEGE